MATKKVRLTKTELKAQREALKRFSRYLPTLQLKQQQLKLETQRLRDELEILQNEEDEYRQDIEPWIHLLSEEHEQELETVIAVDTWNTVSRNVAGIDTQAFDRFELADPEHDLFATPVWYDDVIATVRQLAVFALKRRVLERQLAALEEELRITTQRVNLFDKVMIPDAQENIRRIQIYLGDQQTNAVGRAKIAKRKTQAREAKT